MADRPTETSSLFADAAAIVSSEHNSEHEYYTNLKPQNQNNRHATIQPPPPTPKTPHFSPIREKSRRLTLNAQKSIRKSMRNMSIAAIQTSEYIRDLEEDERGKHVSTVNALGSMCWKVAAAVACVYAMGVFFFQGPPDQPVGDYTLVELQEGDAFWDYYKFHDGKDSEGSNGYNTYVSREKAFALGIANVTEEITMSKSEMNATASLETDGRRMQDEGGGGGEEEKETFVYMNSAPTPQGPRDSIRLEGKKRFDRGLFIIDLRHMPAGCGTWPAFWLTDEANWPVNGEIDIVEGVNYQDTAKTALHSTKGCNMHKVPEHVRSGTWDTAVGVPDKKTGIPDMTFRNATDCFVYNPHQWLNQGCVAVDLEGGSLGVPLNEKGGGVYALEWDPVNGHIRTWVFSPHGVVPENLARSMRTAHLGKADRVVPDPDAWGLPYGYFAIGEGSDCPASHFRNMRLVFNLAFCGSVSGNRYWLDCKNESKIYPTCNEYIRSNPKALEEAYWKIRGVYVYQRSMEKA